MRARRAAEAAVDVVRGVGGCRLPPLGEIGLVDIAGADVGFHAVDVFAEGDGRNVAEEFAVTGRWGWRFFCGVMAVISACHAAKQGDGGPADWWRHRAGGKVAE